MYFFNSNYIIMHNLIALQSERKSKIVQLQVSMEDGRRDLLSIQLRNIANGVKEDYGTYYEKLYGKDRAANLAEAAAILEAIFSVIQIENINLKKRWFFDDLEQILKAWEVQDLPASSRRIRDKVFEVMNSGQKITDAIKPHREGNANALKSDDEITAWVVVMRDSGNNYTNAFIIRQIQEVCALTDKSIPSVSWFEALMASTAIKQLTVGRFGKRGRRAALYQGYNPVLKAIFAGDCWQIDGSRLQLLDWKDENGKAIFLYCVAIRDVRSGAILARTYCLNEDRWVYLDVFKQAMAVTGYIPYDIVTDKFPGHNTEEWETFETRMKLAGAHFTYTERPQGKAQIERWFGTLQTVFSAKSMFYYGEGIQSSRPFAHRSKEQLKTIRKHAREAGWDFDGAIQEAEKIFEAYNHTPLSVYSRKWRKVERTPFEIHEACDKSHVVRLEAHEIAQLSWSRTAKQVLHRMVSPIIDGVEYHFAVDFEVLMKHERTVVCYNPEDLSHIYLFEDGKIERYLGKAERVWAAQLYGPNKDYATLTASDKRNKIIDKQLAERKEALIAPIKGDSGMLNILMGGFAPKADLEQAETEWLKNNLLADDEDRQAAERVRAEDAQEAKIIASELKEAAKGATKAKKAASKKPKENMILPEMVGRVDFDLDDFMYSQM